MFAWPGNPERKILDQLSCELAPGERLGLCGRNGSGKTTFFRCVTGLEKPETGAIILDGRPMRSQKDFMALRREVGFVLQDAEDQLLFPSVLEDAAFGPLNQGLSPAEAEARAREALRLAGVEKLAGALTGQLSGGEKKLVALAGILAMHPKVLLLDEPTNDLDLEARQRIEGLVKNLECAKIVISHDHDFLSRACDRILRLENGRLEEMSG